MELLLVLGLPFAGTLLLAVLGARRFAPEVNVAVSLATLIAAAFLVLRVIRHGSLLVGHDQFFVDSFNVFLVALTAFVGFTTAIFSRPYMRIEQHHGRLNPLRLRLYHSMYQLFMGAMLLALLTNNMGLLWVAMEAATLSTVLLVSLYRTKASLEAAWKYFILCGVGIAQALFGTILLYFAAEQTLGREGMTALLWTHLDAVKGHLEPRVLGLAFVFLLVGYGTKVGLAPLHNWLPDAHAEGPTPVSAVLSGLLGQLLGKTVTPALSIWRIAPIAPEQASYSGIIFLFGTVGVFGITFVLVRLIAHGRMRRTAPWDCGYPWQTPRMQDTAEGFGQPIRHMFGAFFRMERDLPNADDPAPRYRIHIEDRFWRGIYQPIARGVQRIADGISILQGGRLSIYLLYSFVTLLVLLVFVL